MDAIDVSKQFAVIAGNKCVEIVMVMVTANVDVMGIAFDVKRMSIGDPTAGLAINVKNGIVEIAEVHQNASSVDQSIIDFVCMK